MNTPQFRKLVESTLRRGRRTPGISAGLSAVERRTGRLDRLIAAETTTPLGPAIERLKPYAPPATDAPVFVLSAGWRSGSTLLQRLVMSSGSTFIWGEPWNRCDYVVRLADSLRPIGDDWPFPGTLFPGDMRSVDVRRTWIANLFPARGDLIEAHRSFFRRLFADPAHAMGYQAWGFKMVRLNADQAAYLRLLFPSARMVLLYRNPYDAWVSYKASGYRSYRTWPDRPVETAAEFAENWRDLVAGFTAQHQALGAMLVSFEALTSDPDCLPRLQRHLGMELASEVLEHRVGATEKPQPSRFERRRIDSVAGGLARKLGY
ncbi:MAG: sulfotransferase [Pseudomonadales bacterium]